MGAENKRAVKLYFRMGFKLFAPSLLPAGHSLDIFSAATELALAGGGGSEQTEAHAGWAG